ncbi:hypothetical protein [Pedobacter ghigonis]|uniref:hypothetical protein n=1 Tax=Pedobacter ghigonis TaxID=2730403 RepID=UPI001588E756|nr:hypothetical protein [Pedobacter ghigonis]
MKNLNLEMVAVQELDTKEMMENNGGMGYDAGGYGLVYDRSKADGAFYKGFFKGVYDAIFN